MKNRKNIRTASGYTQKEIARIAGVSERTVRYYEAGKSNNSALNTTYGKLLKKSADITQQDIATALNVSKSTISRYERGVTKTPKNEKIERFYSNLQENIRYAKELDKLSSKVWERVTALQESGFGNTPAINQLESRGGLRTGTILGESKQQVQRYISYLRDFLTKQTSTISGAKEWQQNVQESSMVTSGYKDYIENDIFWALYNKLKDDRTITTSWTGKAYDSKQRQEDIKEVFSSVVFDPYWIDINSSDDIETIYKSLKAEIERRR